MKFAKAHKAMKSQKREEKRKVRENESGKVVGMRLGDGGGREARKQLSNAPG